jgi:hypothetical protein
MGLAPPILLEACLYVARTATQHDGAVVENPELGDTSIEGSNDVISVTMLLQEDIIMMPARVAVAALASQAGLALVTAADPASAVTGRPLCVLFFGKFFLFFFVVFLTRPAVSRGTAGRTFPLAPPGGANEAVGAVVNSRHVS